MAKTRVTASTNAVFSAPGALYSVVCEGGASAGTVTVYDNTTQSGTIITAPPVPANSTVEVVFNRCPIATGLSVTFAGGIVACTLEYT